MLKVSDEVRRVCPSAKIAELEELYVKTKGHEVGVIRRADLSPIPSKYALPFHTRVLFQAGLRRTLQLVDATVEEANARRFIPPFLTSRAALETACVIHGTELQIAQLIDEPTRERIDALSLHLLRATFGAKSSRWMAKAEPGNVEDAAKAADAVPATAPKESKRKVSSIREEDLEYTAVNVLTIVQRVAKDYPGIWDLYETLSEFAHPNCAGMGGIFTELDEERHLQIVVDPWSENGAGLVYPFAGLGMSLTLMEASLRWLEETIADFVRVCEEDLYARGDWPARIPYRWKQPEV
jgi:hypothetical protein